MPPSQPVESTASGAVLRVAALLLAVAAVGLPVNHLAGYAVLVAAATILFTGAVTASPTRWLAALAAVLLAYGAHAFVDPPRIEEGHNVFLADGDRAPLAAALPPELHRFMTAELDRVYPPERRCDPQRPGCWRGQGFPDRAYAFSADGIWQQTDLSRRVSGIDFGNPADLRLGATNEGRYNWYPVNSDIQRLARDGRAWKGFDRWQLLMPWYVAYRFPPAFVGAELCWKGDLLWEGAERQFSLWRQPGGGCRTLETADVGRRIFGVAIEPGSLSMRLDPPAGVSVRHYLDAAMRGLAVAAVVALLAGWPRRRAMLPALLMGLVVVAVVVDDAAFLGGFRPHDGGDDGLTYEGFARAIVQHLLNGDVVRALQGEEPVFYYGGPGLRYLRAVERFIFGDTNLGYLSLILLLPVVVFALFRRFLATRWALVLALLFVATPAGALFGSSFFQYLKFAAQGYADPAAYFFFICGFLIIAASAAAARAPFWPAFGGALLLALAVFVRPNIAPLTGAVMAGAALIALRPLRPARLAGLCAGFALVLVMPLHNWLFGGALVLFSSNAANSELLVMPGSAWLAAFGELIRLDLGAPHVGRMLSQLAGWLSGVSESWLTIPLHAAALVVLAHVALRGDAYDRWLRLLAVATLVQQGVGLFYASNPRYYLLTWLLTFVVVAAWARAEGFPWLQRRAPLWSARLMQRGFMQQADASLAALQRRLGLA
jgi:hypothetical protein